MTATDRADAYADDRERLLDELDRADLLLRRHLEAWWARQDGDPEQFRGLYVSDAEVDRLLAAPDGGAATAGWSRDRTSDTRADRTLDRAIEGATDRIEAREAASERESRLARLVAEFDLDRKDVDALLLALSPDLDPKYEKVYGYLQDDVTLVRPSVGLLVRVLAADRHGELADRGRFQPGATLVDEGLLRVAEDASTFVGRTVRVPQRVADYLVGGDGLPAGLAGAAEVIEPDADPDDLPLDGEQRADLDALADRGSSQTPIMAALVGPDESTAAAAVEPVVAGDREILRVDAAALAGEGGEAVANLRREARLRDAAVHVRGLDAVTGSGEAGPADDEADAGRVPRAEAVEDLARALDAVPAPVFLTGDAPAPERLASRLERHRLAVVRTPIPDRDRRAALWGQQDLPADADPGALANAYRLTASGIEDAVETARAIAGGEPDAAALREGCRAQSGRGLEEHAREVEPTYGWDDIVLPRDVERRLREAAAGIRHRGTVFDSWGFADRYSRGTGVSLLFTGPSGTGKTMAAEVIANDVDLPLFAVDLAAMLSKYVGETEENLKRVFDAAERTDAILFFDEADALFGKRSEVSDAHDRYANVEINYLLQRLETHDGPVVLASNLAENIDDAFRRRIDASVEFPHPDRDARAEIWAGVFPEATPAGEVDVDFLAEFELTGGNITNVATAAAFMAAEDGEPVGMGHVVRALRRELQKDGRLFDREDFGEYRGCLPP